MLKLYMPHLQKHFQLCGCVSRRKSASARFLRMDKWVGCSLEHPTAQLEALLKSLFSGVFTCSLQHRQKRLEKNTFNH